MRVLSLIVLVLCASVVRAEEVSFDVQGMRVTVSDRLLPPVTQLPSPVKHLSDEEWFDYVNDYNRQQTLLAEARHKQSLDNGDYKPTIAHVGKSKTSMASTYRATNAFGAPDVYGTYNQGSTGYGGYGGGGFGGYGGGGGGSGGANNSQSVSSSSFDYDKVYKNLGDNGGGPVTKINPYCRDYWMKQAK